MTKTIERLLSKPSAAIIARVALTFPFWMSGVLKLIDFEAGVAEMARVGLEPAALFNIATVVLQLTGSLLVIVGSYVWFGAGALGVFTGLTVLLVHHFWTMTDEPLRTIALHTAAEHIGIIGGLLAAAILAARSQPYGQSAKPEQIPAPRLRSGREGARPTTAVDGRGAGLGVLGVCKVVRLREKG